MVAFLEKAVWTIMFAIMLVSVLLMSAVYYIAWPLVKINKKKAALITAVILLLSTGAWILFTSPTLVEPGTVKVIKEAVGFTKGEIIYELKPHVNESSGTDRVWGWPKVPGKDISKTQEVINFEQLNFEKQIPLWLLDKETGLDQDKQTVVALVVSGKLLVEDWNKFIQLYEPISRPESNTIDLWEEEELVSYISYILDMLVSPIIYDGELRYEFVKEILAEKSFSTVTEVEEFIKNEYPWIWALGEGGYLSAMMYSEYLVSGMIMGDAVATNLYLLAKYESVMSQLPEAFSRTDLAKDGFQRLTKTDLLIEARALFKKFTSYLEQRGRSLVFHDNPDSLEMDIDQFLERETGFSQDGILAFRNLVYLEWQKAFLLALKEDYQDIFEETIKPFFVSYIEEIDEYPAFKLDAYYWQLVIEAALEGRSDYREHLIYSLFRSPLLTETVKAFFRNNGLYYTIENLSINMEERPLFTGDHQINKDFQEFYDYYFGK